MKSRFVKYYMDIAERTAQMSYAVRRQVGSVIVVDNGIVSTGYNGRAVGEPNVCEYKVDGVLVTRQDVIPAEDNAIRRVHERNLCAHGGTIYITLSPCMQCAEKIIESGIKNVIYKNEYSDLYGVRVLIDKGINVQPYSSIIDTD